MSPGGAVQHFLNGLCQGAGVGQGQTRQGYQAGIQSQHMAGNGIEE